MRLVVLVDLELEFVNPVPQDRSRDFQDVEEGPEPPVHLLFLRLVRHQSAQVHQQVSHPVQGQVQQRVLRQLFHARSQNVDRQVHAGHPRKLFSRELEVFERVLLADFVQVPENVLDDERQQADHRLDERLEELFAVLLGDGFVDLGERRVRRSGGSW